MNNPTLTEMLRFMRPEGSEHQRIFCESFIEPIFGKPVDEHGNYVHIIGDEDGDSPTVAFTAHHDTVHKHEGIQYVHVSADKIATAPQSDCLGADCTTGVWLILQMIRAGVPGFYVIHGGEEVGCIGSSNFVKDRGDYLKNLDAVISFDRRGVRDIITHQMGARTASDNFAESLAAILVDDMLAPSSNGAYTDSNEYADIVPECTNLAVGYYNQHTKQECQDLTYAYSLAKRLIEADWSKLVIERDPDEIDYSGGFYGTGGSYKRWSNYRYEDDDIFDYTLGGKKSQQTGSTYNVYLLQALLFDYSDEVADLLDDWGITYENVVDELISANPNLAHALANRYGQGRV